MMEIEKPPFDKQHRLKKTKEIKQLNAMLDPRLDHGPDINIIEIGDKIWIRSVAQLTLLYEREFPDFDTFTIVI